MFLGKYMGYIRNVSDPETRGRIRVFCPEVVGPSDDADHWLDWALPQFPWLAHLGVGLNFVPEKTTEWAAWIEFRQGDPKFPIWTGLFPLGPVDITKTKILATELVALIVKNTVFDVIDGKIRVGGDTVDQKMVKGTFFWHELSAMFTKLKRDLLSMQAAAQGSMSGLQPGLAAAIADLEDLLAKGLNDAFLSELGWLR